jgi:hypothetical protein
LRQAFVRQFNPHQPFVHKLLHWRGVSEMKLPRGADHYRPPVADRPALAILLLQQPPGFGIQPQQEARIGRHLGFESWNSQ